MPEPPRHVLIVAADADALQQCLRTLRREAPGTRHSIVPAAALATALLPADVAAVVLCCATTERAPLLPVVNDLVERAAALPLLAVTRPPAADFEAQLIQLGMHDCLPSDALDQGRLVRALSLAAARAARTAELERACRCLHEFAHLAGHELRGPLTVVVSSLELLLRLHAAQLEPEARDCAAHSLAAAQEVADLLNELLELAEPAAAVDVEPVDCSAILARVRAVLSARRPGADARVSSDPLPIVLTRAPLLQRVLYDLIAAALGLDDGSRVHVSCRPDAEGWQFTLACTGADQNRCAIEQSFAPRSAPGREGLRPRPDLAFAREAVARLGGRVRVTAGGPGTWALQFFLPAAPP